MKKLLLSVLAISLLIRASAFCSDTNTVISPLPGFTSADRILVLAPHPDDEAIGTGGVIQQAAKAKIPLQVVLFTNGDHNEWAFIVYEKHPVLTRKEFIKMGEIRRKESLNGLSLLGLSLEQVVFLGYPDFGTLEIFTKYWGSAKPYKDILTQINHVPYNYALSPGSIYTGENILRDLKKVIREFKPTKIFVSHPVDFNRDHKGLYLFTQVALWDLAGEIKLPEVYPYIIHVRKWPNPLGDHRELGLNIPKKLINAPLNWYELKLDQNQENIKYSAIKCYRSQIDYEPWYLVSFARNNELFCNYPMVKVPKQAPNGQEWNNTGVSGSEEEQDQQKAYLSKLSYAIRGNSFYVRASLKKKLAVTQELSIYLIGYSKTTAFDKMPKINCSVSWGLMKIRDKGLVLKNTQGARAIFTDEEIFIEIPLALLGNPDYILTSARNLLGEFPLDDTAWRILAIE
ncbi:MAG: PIG-L family deacetylase [bacterium]|nr:PIG-L family deacetylase [bacterium]